MNISPANTQSTYWQPDTKPLSQYLGLLRQGDITKANPIEAQSEYRTPETKPLSQHIGFANEEEVFENGMTLREITTKAMLLELLDNNVKKLKYGYQAHLNQESLKELNLLGASADDMGLSLDEFLSSDTASLCMPALEAENGDGGIPGQITGITSNVVMPVDMPDPVRFNLKTST